jgi:hypothetical protein
MGGCFLTLESASVSTPVSATNAADAAGDEHPLVRYPSAIDRDIQIFTLDRQAAA